MKISHEMNISTTNGDQDVLASDLHLIEMTAFSETSEENSHLAIAQIKVQKEDENDFRTFYCTKMASSARLTSRSLEGNMDYDTNLRDLPTFPSIWNELTSNRSIHQVSLNGMSFTKEEMEALEESAGGTKGSVTALNLERTNFTDGVDSLRRFIKQVRPRILTITEEDSEGIHSLFSPSFLDVISSLSYFRLQYQKRGMCTNWPLNPLSEISRTFHKFPPVFLCSHAIRFHIESLRNAIQAWYVGELSVIEWEMNLSREYLDTTALSAAIGLDCLIRLDRIFYTRPDGSSSIFLERNKMGFKDTPHTTSWRICEHSEQ